ncbi:MAG: MerR family transcriptional regulator [Polyangiaceae bacterium]|nr:MerR family transcriptional regulator [Polyangiaceae bacterium]
MSTRTDIPAKLFFRIGEASSLVGVEPHVLRYWETEFRSIRPKKSARGQRVYTRREVESLVRIKELLYDHGFTIAGAKRRLREKGFEPPEPGDRSSGESRKMRQALVETRAELTGLLQELTLELAGHPAMPGG